MPTTIQFTQTNDDLTQILHLQNQNHIQNLSQNDREQNGFVTIKHDIEVLHQMNAIAKQIIAKSDGKVVGYALVMFKELSSSVLALIPMFDMFKQLSYQGQKLEAYKYYVMGQICVADGFRGQGIFEALYQKHKEVYAHIFDFCLTEVSVRNLRSMRAHEKVGFKIIHTFKDENEEWNILLWDWK